MKVQNETENTRIQTEIPAWQQMEIKDRFYAYTKIPNSPIQFDKALEILYKYVNDEN